MIFPKLNILSIQYTNLLMKFPRLDELRPGEFH